MGLIDQLTEFTDNPTTTLVHAGCGGDDDGEETLSVDSHENDEAPPSGWYTETISFTFMHSN